MNMDEYAVISQNKIINTVVWDGLQPWSQPDGSTVMLLSDALAAGIQYAPTPPPVRRVWETAGDFWEEFTAEEQLAISSSSAPEVQALVVSFSVWPAKMWSDDARVQAGFKALTQSGLLTKARANEILNPPGLKE